MAIKDTFSELPRSIFESNRLTDDVRSQLRGIGSETGWNADRIMDKIRGPSAPVVSNLPWNGRTASIWDADQLISYKVNKLPESVTLMWATGEAPYKELGQYDNDRDAKEAALNHYRREYLGDTGVTRAEIWAAIDSSKRSARLSPVVNVVEMDGSRILTKLGYNRMIGSPSGEDVRSCVTHYYPGHQIERASDNYNGIVTLVLAQMDPGNMPVDSGDPGTKRGPGVGEELEGTTGEPTGQVLTAQQAPPPADPAQAAPPADPNQPPADGAPQQDPDQPPAEESMADSGMSLEDALAQLGEAIQSATDAAQSVKERVESGDAILHGQEVEMYDDAPPPAPAAAAPINQPAAAAPVGGTPVQAQLGGTKGNQFLEDMHKQELLEKLRGKSRDTIDKMNREMQNQQPPKPKPTPITPVLRKKDAPKPEKEVAPQKTPEEAAKEEEKLWYKLDELFHKRWPGKAGTATAGMQSGFERIPVKILEKLVQRGGATRRGYNKTDPVTGKKEWVQSSEPKWDVLTPEELDLARSAMEGDYEEYKKRVRSVMRSENQNSGLGKPHKIEAVDQEAKDYWEDLFGPYGVSMTEEKVAALASDAIEICASLGMAADENQLIQIVSTVANRPAVHGALMKFAQDGQESDDALVDQILEISQSNHDVSKVVDRMTLEFLIKNSDALHNMSLEQQRSMMWRAVRADGRYRKRLMNLRDKALGIVKPPAAPAEAAPAPAPLAPEIGVMAMKLTAAGFKQPKPNKGLDDAVDVVKMEDIGTKPNPVVPGHIPMTHSKPTQRGIYVHLTVTWEPDDVKVGGQSLLHSIENYVKGVASHREFTDFGFIGNVHIDDVDPKAGSASVYFRAKDGAGGAVKEVKETSKE
jgi:hypothetical protein